MVVGKVVSNGQNAFMGVDRFWMLPWLQTRLLTQGSVVPMQA